jgi:hypothetical protein
MSEVKCSHDTTSDGARPTLRKPENKKLLTTVGSFTLISLGLMTGVQNFNTSHSLFFAPYHRTGTRKLRSYESCVHLEEAFTAGRRSLFALALKPVADPAQQSLVTLVTLVTLITLRATVEPIYLRGIDYLRAHTCETPNQRSEKESLSSSSSRDSSDMNINLAG